MNTDRCDKKMTDLLKDRNTYLKITTGATNIFQNNNNKFIIELIVK